MRKSKKSFFRMIGPRRRVAELHAHDSFRSAFHAVSLKSTFLHEPAKKEGRLKHSVSRQLLFGLIWFSNHQ